LVLLIGGKRKSFLNYNNATPMPNAKTLKK
jgi:hypothetical protein